MMMGKRIGKWGWTLSPQERLAAVLVGVPRVDPGEIDPALQSTYDSMLDKQRKLDARAR